MPSICRQPPLCCAALKATCHLISLLLLLCSTAAAHGVQITPGHGGHWFDPERSGEGWVLEMMDSEQALLYWFTYDETGEQRWMTAVGHVRPSENGERIEFPELVVTRGGRFGADFDPGEVEREAVGSANIKFSGCDAGTFTFQAFGQSRTIALQRLARTMGARCESINGIPGRAVNSNAGQSGSWYDPSHSGEGYSLQWMSPTQALMTWYTYDLEGNQFWILGVGELEGSRTVFRSAHSTRGGRFGNDFDPEDVERLEWGSLTLSLECESGLAEYASVIPEFGNGHLDLSRLTRLAELSCPWQKPKLEDLYEVSFTPIPIATGTPAYPNRVEARAIDDNGVAYAVLGGETGYTIQRFFPGATAWEILPNDRLHSAIFVTPDGDTIFATQRNDELSNWKPVRWTSDSGWQDLPEAALPESVITGASPDRSRLVGESKIEDTPTITWLWDADGGQVALPVTPQIPGAYPHAASNDGRTVVAATLRPGSNNFARPLAVQWAHGQGPTILSDNLGAQLGRPLFCSSQCEYVFGVDQSAIDPGHPNYGQPWVITGGQTYYLGSLESVVLLPGRSHFPLDASHDGTMVVGSFAISGSNAEAFVWTQNTGMVSIGDVMSALNLAPRWTHRYATSMTSDGRQILLGGEITREGTMPHLQAGIIKLTLK